MNKAKQKKVRENQKLTHSSEISMNKDAKVLAGSVPFNVFARAKDAAMAMQIQAAKQKAGMLDLGFRYHTAAERHGNSCSSFSDAKHERQRIRELKRWAKLTAEGKARVVTAANGTKYFEIIPVSQRLLAA